MNVMLSIVAADQPYRLMKVRFNDRDNFQLRIEAIRPSETARAIAA